MKLYKAVVSRLAMLGYEVADDDKAKLECLICECEMKLLANINRSELPPGLFFVLVDMVAGHFLSERKAVGALDGFDFEAPVKSISEGDVSVTFASGNDGDGTAEAHFDALLTKLMCPAESTLAAFRRMRW